MTQAKYVVDEELEGFYKLLCVRWNGWRDGHALYE